MMGSVPLLLVRSEQGLGPNVPVRSPVGKIVVEGLFPTDSLVVWAKSNGKIRKIDLKEGETYLGDDPIPEGSVLRAELDGIDSCVSIWLE